MSKPWTPRAYQLESLEFSLGALGTGLLLDPGLGKTSTYLALICLLKERGDIRTTLVCAPRFVAQTVWPVEAKLWDDFKHLKVVELTDRTQDQVDELLERGADVFVINPESLYKVLNPLKIMDKPRGQHIRNRWNIDLLIVDESPRFADPSTERFKMLKWPLRNIEYRKIATGTPTPNGYQQLFGQCYLLDFGEALGEYITHFRQRYMHPHPNVKFTYVMNPGAGDVVLEKVSHLLLRMRAKDHLQMPELVTSRIRVKLDPPIREMYDKFERDYLISVLDETIPAFNKASLAIKCRQVCNGFIYSQQNKGTPLIIHEKKLDALENLLEELQGRPLLLMYEFIADGLYIQQAFSFAVSLTGAKDVSKVIRDFNDGKIPLLIAHPKSAGHGLNLQQACSDICWFGFNLDLELWIQAIARVWRQGQLSPVVKNHVICVEDSVDEATLEGLDAKEANQDYVDQALITYAKRKIG